MRLLIVDDEALARKRLRALLAGNNQYEIVGEAESGDDCLHRTAACRPDIVLLDIRMPGMDGIETARHLATLPDPPAVIFVTAYDSFAVEAFDAHAVDYLLKPVRKARLAESLGRAARPTRPQLAALADKQSAPRRRIAAKLGDTLRLIPVDSIFYLRAEQKYVTAYHEAGCDLINESLKDLEQEFPEKFLRIHRNTLVSVQCITGLQRDEEGSLVVRLDGVAGPLAVSRRHAAEVRKRIKSAPS